MVPLVATEPEPDLVGEVRDFLSAHFPVTELEQDLVLPPTELQRLAHELRASEDAVARAAAAMIADACRTRAKVLPPSRTPPDEPTLLVHRALFVVVVVLLHAALLDRAPVAPDEAESALRALFSVSQGAVALAQLTALEHVLLCAAGSRAAAVLESLLRLLAADAGAASAPTTLVLGWVSIALTLTTQAPMTARLGELMQLVSQLGAPARSLAVTLRSTLSRLRLEVPAERERAAAVLAAYVDVCKNALHDEAGGRTRLATSQEAGVATKRWPSSMGPAASLCTLAFELLLYVGEPLLPVMKQRAVSLVEGAPRGWQRSRCIEQLCSVVTSCSHYGRKPELLHMLFEATSAYSPGSVPRSRL